MAKKILFRQFPKPPRRTTAHRLEVDTRKVESRVKEKIAALNMKRVKGLKYSFEEDEKYFYIMAETDG